MKKAIWLLTVLIIITSCAFVGCKETINYGKGTRYYSDYEVEFGHYPRSEVSSELTQTLEQAYKNGELIMSGDYYQYGEAQYAMIVVKNNYKGSIDGESRFDELSDSDFERFTGYTVGSVHWFTVEPIVWKVLNTQNGLAVLTTKELIDCTYYGNNDTNKEYLWENSHLRNWLNSEFYEKAFNQNEKDMIRTTETDCSYISNPGRLKYSRTTVQDKVRVLSWKEARLPKQFADDLSRTAKVTDYSACIGGARLSEKVIIDEGNDVSEYSEFLNCGSYWLLDTELNMNNVYMVNTNGETLSYHSYLGSRTVRPVIIMTTKNLKKIKTK